MKSDYQILKRYYFDAYPEARTYDGITLTPTIKGGHRNANGLTAEGEFAVEEMMRQGMMIDMDHASEKSVTGIMRLAMINDYPVNSGHNGIRTGPGCNENTRTAGQLDTVRRVGGMLGVGWGENTAAGFNQSLKLAYTAAGGKNIALGSDINGFVATPGPPESNAQFINYTNSASTDYIQKYTMPGSRSWDFNTDGVAHYGLVPDFFQGMKKAGAETNVLNSFFLGAEWFAQMWEKCERRAPAVRR
jgi:microsomal dipeptidase-like Zn-dependent dipeptidase